MDQRLPASVSRVPFSLSSAQSVETAGTSLTGWGPGRGEDYL